MPDIAEPLVSEPMRSVASLQPPAFAMPPGATDSHMHAFGPAGKYPHVARPHYTLPDGTLEHYETLMPALGLEHFVIVQPSFYGTDNSCLVDCLGRAGGRARGVAMVEENASDGELRRLHDAGIRGLRLDLFKRSGDRLEDLQAYITAMAQRVAPLGWHLQFYVPGWVVRNLIGFLHGLQIDFVIDHMGYMLEEDGLTEADFSRLLALMTEGRCWIKLSGPYRIAKKRGYAAVEHVARAIVAAGPDRAIWGSDWPHIPEGGRDTGELLNLLTVWAPDEAIRNRILSDNPRRLFGFSGT